MSLGLFGLGFGFPVGRVNVVRVFCSMSLFLFFCLLLEGCFLLFSISFPDCSCLLAEILLLFFAIGRSSDEFRAKYNERITRARDVT